MLVSINSLLQYWLAVFSNGKIPGKSKFVRVMLFFFFSFLQIESILFVPSQMHKEDWILRRNNFTNTLHVFARMQQKSILKGLEA